MKLTLYYAPQTCATVPYITLTEAGADFDVYNINTRSGQNHSPEFLKLNPKHKIQIWIKRQFPHARLLPADPGDEIKAISLMGWFGSGIHPHLTPNARPQNYCDVPGSEESVKRVANKLLFDDLRIADDRLAGREWFFEHFTACDAYFFWCIRRALSFQLDLSSFRNCMVHFERMQQRASVQKVVAHEKQVMEAFAKAA
jgi:glutathione S-transferase